MCLGPLSVETPSSRTAKGPRHRQRAQGLQRISSSHRPFRMTRQGAQTRCISEPTRCTGATTRLGAVRECHRCAALRLKPANSARGRCCSALSPNRRRDVRRSQHMKVSIPATNAFEFQFLPSCAPPTPGYHSSFPGTLRVRLNNLDCRFQVQGLQAVDPPGSQCAASSRRGGGPQRC